ncbi:uncharacterized protein LOC119692281 [Plutella xylostella]|uniref:uncharacterized protein LOC119692281 n=1 Tax=Plutella xylostella TaxID=51655 RepID=UPI002032D7BA|nr:uncharacterized protein LOC119692281 [Plutella xylostella]
MTCEYLSEDILQANFFKCTSPVYYAQLLCGTNRVDIRDNFATSVTKGQKLYSLLIILGVTLSYSYFAFNYYELYSVTSPTILYMSIVGMVLHYTTYLLNQCFLRLTKQTDNIRLVVLLNKIDCLLNINHESDLNNLQYYWSATAVFLTALVFFFGYGVHVVGTVPQYPVFTCFISIQLYSYLLEIICIGAYVYYVAVRMRLCSYLIRSMVSKLLSKYDCGDAVEVSHRVELRNVTVCLSYILEAFRTIEKIFRYSVSIKIKLSINSTYTYFPFNEPLCLFQIFSILSLNFVWTFLVLIAMTEGVRKQVSFNVYYERMGTRISIIISP